MQIEEKGLALILVAVGLALLAFWVGPSETAEKSAPTGVGVEREIPAPDQLYRESCGQCHLAYPPEFLPVGSWERLLKDPRDHFGESLFLEPRTQAQLVAYLTSHGAEKSSSKKARKILADLEGKTPLRITETPYIRNKHRLLTPAVLEKSAVRSLSHCQACHQRATEWVFDAKVRLPE